MENLKEKLSATLSPENIQAPAEQIPQAEPPVMPESDPAQKQAQTHPQQQQINPLQLAQAAINANQNEIAQLKQQLQQAQQINAELQQKSEETVMQTLTAPIFPHYDYDNSSDDDRNNIIKKYNEELANYVGGSVKEQMKPYANYVQQQTRQSEENNIINGIIRSGQLPDFEEKLPEIQKLAPQAQYPIVYFLLKGHETVNTKPTEDTAESLLAKVKANPDVIKALKAEEIAAVKQNGEVPPHIVSGGASNIAATLPPQGPTELKNVKYFLKNKI
jgi:hypothetical protein